jgi:hypothetical protein
LPLSLITQIPSPPTKAPCYSYAIREAWLLSLYYLTVVNTLTEVLGSENQKHQIVHHSLTPARLEKHWAVPENSRWGASMLEQSIESHITQALVALSNSFVFPSSVSSPNEPPPSFRCGEPSERLVTHSSNRNSKARARTLDAALQAISRLCHDRGNYPNNPPCRCDSSSKRQATCADRPRKILLYLQAWQMCVYQRTAKALDSDGMVRLFANLGLVW